MGADGGLVVSLAAAEPVAEPAFARVAADLRRSTAALVEAAAQAGRKSLAATVVNVNPFARRADALDSVRMAALHARHHIRNHLCE